MKKAEKEARVFDGKYVMTKMESEGLTLDMEQFEKDIRANFTIPAFVAFKSRCIVNDVTAYLVTRPENFDFVRKTGHVPCKTLQEAWNLAQEKLAKQGKKDYTITIMGHASATLPILDK